MKTVSRVYDTYSQARDAVRAVEGAGVPSSEVSLVANKYVSEKYADVNEVSPTAGGLVGALVGAGTSDDHAHVYAESVRRGGTLVSARVEDSEATRIQACLLYTSPSPRDGLLSRMPSSA